MPLTIFHAVAGAAAGATSYALECAIADQTPDAETLAQSALIGGLAGAMPDILEPPINRYHRSLFHSAATLGTAAWLFAQIDENENLDSRGKSLARSALAAYMSHLLLDSATPVGMPLLIEARGLLRIPFT